MNESNKSNEIKSSKTYIFFRCNKSFSRSIDRGKEEEKMKSVVVVDSPIF